MKKLMFLLFFTATEKLICSKKKKEKAQPIELVSRNRGNISLNKLDKGRRNAIKTRTAFALPKISEIVEKSREKAFDELDESLQRLRDESFRAMASALLAVAELHADLQQQS